MPLLVDDKELNGKLKIEDEYGEVVGTNTETGAKWEAMTVTDLYNLLTHRDTTIEVIEE